MRATRDVPRRRARRRAVRPPGLHACSTRSHALLDESPTSSRVAARASIPRAMADCRAPPPTSCPRSVAYRAGRTRSIERFREQSGRQMADDHARPHDLRGRDRDRRRLQQRARRALGARAAISRACACSASRAAEISAILLGELAVQVVVGVPIGPRLRTRSGRERHRRAPSIPRPIASRSTSRPRRTRSPATRRPRRGARERAPRPTPARSSSISSAC